MKRSISTLTYLLIVISISVGIAAAQTTEFAYQGNLQNGGTAANGNYDLEFKLYDAASVGGQIGVTASRSNVAVNSGTFAVTLDFGAGSFPGPDRWIEIGIRPAGSGGGFQQLLPRTKLSSSPYAIQSLNAATAINATTAATATNATQLGGVAANQYVVTTDPRMTDARPPTAGSSNYIQNTTSPQAGSNFNISGNGTAGGTLSGNIVNSATQFNIGGVPVLKVTGQGIEPESNTFVGVEAGANNTGGSNSFFGVRAGRNNTTAHSNSFFGRSSGLSNNGQANSFFGHLAGSGNTEGSGNAFFGMSAGRNNSTGSGNTAIGFKADFATVNLSFATAIGSNAIVSNSNSVVLGRPGGEDTVRIPGRLDAMGNLAIGVEASPLTVGTNNLYIANNGGEAENVLRLDGSNNNFYMIARSNAGAATGAGIIFRTSDAGGGETTRMTITPSGTVDISGNLVQASGGLAVFNSPVRFISLSTGGATALCRNASDFLSTCSSSLRYKTNVNKFGFGVDLIKQLKPITFDWKDGGMHDLGLGAEDVAAIEPLLVTYNSKGHLRWRFISAQLPQQSRSRDAFLRRTVEESPRR